MILNTIILKVAAPCNLNCSYCYEYNRGDETWRAKPKQISREILLQIGSRLSQYCEDNKISDFNINLHGGEPLLIGPHGLEMVFNTLKESTPLVRLKFGVQTNGTLLNSDIINTLKAHGATVGVSLDGGRIHNRFRISHNGQEAYERIVSGINAVKHEKRMFTGLQAVIDLWSEPEEVLDALSAFDPISIDLLPPFGNYENPPFTGVPKYSLGSWLIRAFDHWINSPTLQRIRVRYLEDALFSVLSGQSRSDWFGVRPPGYVVVATDGAYEGLDTLKVAGDNGRTTDLSVMTDGIEDLITHEIMTMRDQGIKGLCLECRECSISEWCGGGYLPTRYRNTNGFDNPSYYCADMKALFKHIGLWSLGRGEIDPKTHHEIQSRLTGLESETR